MRAKMMFPQHLMRFRVALWAHQLTRVEFLRAHGNWKGFYNICLKWKVFLLWPVFFSSRDGEFSHFAVQLVKRSLSFCRFCCCNNYTFRVMEKGHAIKIIKRKRGAKRTLTFLTPSSLQKNFSATPTALKKCFSLCSVAQIHHATHHRVEFVFRTLYNEYFLGSSVKRAKRRQRNEI